MRTLKALMIVGSMTFHSAFAEAAVVAYIENEGQFIELCENKVDQLYGDEGSMMAIESPEIATEDNRQRIDPEDVIVRWWKMDGDEWVIIYFKETRIKKSFHRSEVKTIVVDRPWYNEPLIPDIVDPA